MYRVGGVGVARLRSFNTTWWWEGAVADEMCLRYSRLLMCTCLLYCARRVTRSSSVAVTTYCSIINDILFLSGASVRRYALCASDLVCSQLHYPD